MVAVHLRRPRTKVLAIFLLPAVRYDQMALGARLIQFMPFMLGTRGSSVSVRSFLSRLVSCPPVNLGMRTGHFPWNVNEIKEAGLRGKHQNKRQMTQLV